MVGYKKSPVHFVNEAEGLILGGDVVNGNGTGDAILCTC